MNNCLVEWRFELPSKSEKHLRMKGNNEEQKQTGPFFFLDKAMIIYHQGFSQKRMKKTNNKKKPNHI